MRKWFADGVFRTVLRNAGYLISGKLAGALFSLLAFACAGRALDRRGQPLTILPSKNRGPVSGATADWHDRC